MRILVVEDNSIIASLITSHIDELPGKVEYDIATTAVEAIEIIHSDHPDIVTLDIHLAKGTGYEVLAAISKLENPPRVIMLSNLDSEEVSGRCILLGAERYFDKASQFEMFFSVLSDWVIAAQRTSEDFECRAGNVAY
ncbi:MAG: response regulator [Sedimenticola sp.]